MTNEIWYTARNIYGPEYEVESSWKKYIESSKLFHLKELVSLDSILNELTFDPDFESDEDWKFIITDDGSNTGFFSSLDYVLEKSKGTKYFNLITAIKEPGPNKLDILKDEYDFVGYELLDMDYEVCALTNCGGFDETFLPNDLKEFGLVNDYERSKEIQQNLLKNNPEEHHAECNLFEVWRHKTIGRKI